MTRHQIHAELKELGIAHIPSRKWRWQEYGIFTLRVAPIEWRCCACKKIIPKKSRYLHFFCAHGPDGQIIEHTCVSCLKEFEYIPEKIKLALV